MQGYLLNTEVLLMVQMNLSLSHNVAVDPLQGIGLGVRAAAGPSTRRQA